MYLSVNLLFIGIVIYHIYRVGRTLKELKSRSIFPSSEMDYRNIRLEPLRTIDYPEITYHKKRLVIYGCLLVLIWSAFFYALFTEELFPIYLFIIPFTLFSYQVLNTFAIKEEGLMIGTQFIPWQKIKYYQFVRIDVNHKFYGHTKEVNDSYELKVKLGFTSASCIITLDETKDQIATFLASYAPYKQKLTPKEEETENESVYE